jgi:hypothetical protein
MIDCIFQLNADGKLQCANCGWTYPREPNSDSCKWPRRNCRQSPDLQPAADKLGVSMADVAHYAYAVARWTAAGFPTREPAEVDRIERELCRPCAEYVDGRCKQCGCAVNKGPAIRNKIAMATENCKLGEW